MKHLCLLFIAFCCTITTAHALQPWEVPITAPVTTPDIPPTNPTTEPPTNPFQPAVQPPHQPPTPPPANNSAFTDGKSFGAGLKSTVTGSITDQNGAAIVPGYSTKGSAAVESSYFQNGNGVLPGLGTGKAITCSTGPRSNDPYARSECNAVNFVSGSKDQCDQLYPQIVPSQVAMKKSCEALDAKRYVSPGLQGVDYQYWVDNCSNNPAMQSVALTQYVRLNCDDVRTRQIPKIASNDPMAITAKTITSSPDTVMAAAPGNGLNLSNGYYTGCQTVTTNTQPLPVTDSCYEYRATVKGAICTEARDVQVDPGHPVIPAVPDTCTTSTDADGVSTTSCCCGSPEIPAQAPSLIKDVAPSPCKGYTADAGENISGCRTKTLCTDGPSTKTYGWDNSLQITHDCWSWNRDYACETPLDPPVDNCQGFRSKGCQEVAQTCTESNIDGVCVAYKHDFQCSKPGSTSTVMNCADRKFCIDGNCFDAGSPADKDFANAVTGKEGLREAGIYQEGYRLFNGKDSRCEKWPARCCSGGGGGFSFTNHVIRGAIGAAGSAAYTAAGSTYMYDALFSSSAPDWVVNGFGAMFQSGGFESGLAGILSGEITVSALAAGMSTDILMQMLMPSPWTIAIMAYQWLMSCDQDATMTAMKKDTGLCVDLGEYCSRKLPIFNVCIQRKKTYCCFNSKLAKIINQEGKRQLGRGNGSAQNPDCSGLTADDFNLIDFSRAPPGTWDEFIEQIKPTMPDANKAIGQVGTTLPVATQTILEKYKNYYQR